MKKKNIPIYNINSTAFEEWLEENRDNIIEDFIQLYEFEWKEFLQEQYELNSKSEDDE